ncbi:DUF6273 domain-containing protein [uncultured Ruminococcus sp.]|uniref:DUF6273 domain-containing protein n=1 Tax=uncultured Ruminococcus sp. TaxID=165186 RepID=UPI0025D900A1|nr:DUF6273 domain-containing protein [uncultured Ruminococcus sp.]
MAETIDLVRDSTMQETNRILTLIAGKEGGFTPKSWKDVQLIVRQGLAKTYFSVGDQFTVEKATAINATVGNTTGETSGVTSATVDISTFVAQIGTAHSDDYEFTYDGAAWHYGDTAVSLAAYGITVAGTAKLGDAVVVHETASKMIVTVLGIDQDTPAEPQLEHSLTLGWQDCYAELQYDGTETLFAFPDGLAAGTYHFTIDSTYDTTNNDYSGYQFTLTKAIPQNGVIMFPWVYNTKASTTKVSSYASTSATSSLETVSVTNGTDGTSLGNATVAGTPESSINSIHRARYGSNNWKESAMRQLINSGKVAGQVWTPQTKYDRPPNWVTSTAGFLYGMDPDFVSVIGKVKKRTAKNVANEGGEYEDSVEEVFLLSRSEVYAGNESNINEGGPYDYFKDFSDSAAATAGKDTNRIKYRNNSAKNWLLRSPDVGYANGVRVIYPSGELNSYSAYGAYGVAPACCIV